MDNDGLIGDNFARGGRFESGNPPRGRMALLLFSTDGNSILISIDRKRTRARKLA
jgi:hypothetical protein